MPGQDSDKPRQRIGLIAGSGRFPLAFAEAAHRRGYSVYCISIDGSGPEELAEWCDRIVSIPVAKLGRMIRHFKRAQIDRVVMAGKVQKTLWFQPFRMIRLLPDLRGLHCIYKYTRENKTDDTLLLALIREFARDQIIFESALDYCPELLVNHGFLTRRKPSPAQWRDIKFGWEMAKEIGRLDIGQTVIVNDTAVIAVEAIEGTDAAIERAGDLCKRGGFTVVKVAKPQQDRRFDVPTIGTDTLKQMHEAGGRVLAIESNQTIMLDQEEVIGLADRLGIAIVALNAEELQLRLAS